MEGNTDNDLMHDRGYQENHEKCLGSAHPDSYAGEKGVPDKLKSRQEMLGIFLHPVK